MMAKKTHIRFLRLLFAIAVIVAGFAVSASALSPKEYREQLISAEAGVRGLSSFDRDSDPEREMIAEILTNIPEKVRIEWSGNIVETNNAWLSEKLELYQKSTDYNERRLIVLEIEERLSVIILEVEALEKAASAGPTKDSDKQKLAEILSRPEYQQGSAGSQSLFRQWLERFLEWITSLFPRGPSPSVGDAGFGNVTFWLQIVLITLIVGIIGFLLYKFAPAFLPGLRRSRRDNGDRIILGERITADESSSDLLSEAERLVREGNIRAAIRKGYIALLCELSDRKLIGLAGHKTNRDYVRDLRKNAGLQNDVRALTEKFELHWYGGRTAANSDWEEFRKDYRRAVDH